MSDAGILGNWYHLILWIWPGVTIGCALLNMLITFKFSWSELIIDYFIGLVIGICFYFGTSGKVNWVEYMFLTFSVGVWGLLKWVGIWSDMSVGQFFMICAVYQAVSVVVTAALDYAAVAIDWEEGKKGAKTGNVFISIIIFIFKWPCALATSIVGLLIGLFGMIGAEDREFGFLGGAFWFVRGSSGIHATTFGCIVNVFNGKITAENLIGHELVHTRQYLYMHDWLGVFFFTVAGIWGLISNKREGYFQATEKGKGNPIEVVPEKKYPKPS